MIRHFMHRSYCCQIGDKEQVVEELKWVGLLRLNLLVDCLRTR